MQIGKKTSKQKRVLINFIHYYFSRCYNDNFTIPYFTDSLTLLSKEIQYSAAYAPPLPLITLLSYYIKVSPLAPHAFLGMLPICVSDNVVYISSQIKLREWRQCSG